MTGTATAEINTKGLSFVHLRQYLLDHFGEKEFDRVCDALSPECAAIFRSPFAHEWYPLKIQAAIEAKTIELLYQGDYRRAEDFGRNDAQKQIGSVYRFLLAIMAPGFLVKKADRLWKLSMSGGRCEVDQVNERGCRVRLSAYNSHHEVLCYDWLGSFKGMLEVCGVKNPVVEHTACRFRSSLYCEYLLRW